ncbi:inorganic diphosphatase [uncultured Serinicoccus sp.]|uniref:inorganic diphosphatase n=1 Tax=uncultured Serinicoccus sp. TaxID=735514 RepID=UPI00261C70A1|nr:inorganic diphosphatase [uncultured Serinicoccus sp.]
MQFDVTIEIPQGSRNKYEVDHATGRIRLDRMLFTATRYPADYGYIEETLGEDGDPLDALVLLDEPTWPGCLVLARPIGMFHMRDEAGGDDKIICVPAEDPRKLGIQNLDDIGTHTRLEIQHFFEVYKDLEPGKSVEGAHWAGREEAEQCYLESVKRAKDEGMSTARWPMPQH